MYKKRPKYRSTEDTILNYLPMISIVLWMYGTVYNFSKSSAGSFDSTTCTFPTKKRVDGIAIFHKLKPYVSYYKYEEAKHHA